MTITQTATDRSGITTDASPASGSVKVVNPQAQKQDQTITFGALGPKTFGDADFNVSATASSNQPVSFAASGNCTVSGTTVHITGAGNCDITASQAGSADYNPAPNVTRGFLVAKKTATVNLSNLDRVYDGNAKTVDVSTSNPAGLNVNVTYDGDAQAPTDAGSYAVVANVSDNNYQGSARGTLVIAKATPQITWSNPADITYGTALGDAQLNASADVGGSFGYTPAPGTKLGAGDNQDLKVAFTPNDAGNYDGASKTVQINVNKAGQAIAFGALDDKTYGDADFALSASSDSGLDVSFDSKTPAKCSVSDGSVSILEAGTCTIEASQAGNSNYNTATTVARSFEIAKKTASITLGGLGHTYDGTTKAASASTTPSGLNVDLAYSQNGQAVAAPKDAGDYHVVATINNANYQGSKEGTLSIAKASQSIDFGAVSDKTFDDADFNLSAAGGNSGNDVIFVASGNCTVQGGTVSITGAGSCTITASQAGNSNYEAAQNVQRSFDIAKAKATLSLVAADLGQVYDGSARTVGVNTDPDVPNKQINVTYDGVAQAPTDAGSYRVVASLGEHANYFAEDVAGTLEVAKAPAELSFAAGTLSKTYDGQAHSVSVDTDPAGLGGVSVTYDGGQTRPTDAGSYAVVANLDNRNYRASDLPGTLTVAKKALSVKAADASREYGDPNPAFAGVLSGAVNADNISASYATAATKASDVGAYPIVPALNDPNGRLANYDVSKTDGTLTVTKATLRATAADAEKVYGDALGAADLTGSVTGVKNGDPIAASYSSAGAAASSDAGSYPIVPALDATAAVLANYHDPGLTNGTLRVTKAPLVIKANDASRFYGDPNPALTGSIVSGVKNNDVLNLSFTTTALHNSPVGTYAIVPEAGGAKAGNYLVSAQNGTLTIGSWAFKGFYQPVDMSGTLNTVKGGSTVPIKFQIFKGTAEVTDVAQVKALQAAKVNCTTATQDAVEEFSATGATALRYDATGGQFIYNWKTPTTANTCYKVTITANDGSSKSALFKTK
ncbi:MAG TPA: MBG domain-containing protein [Rubrobacter sp.]|nr:MBG domain-containing protein [Rubrobacter sp.]